MAITQSEFKQMMMEATELPKKEVDFFFEVMADVLREDVVAKAQKVSIPGIGILTCKVAEARLARNPATGAKVKVPPKVRVSLRLAKTLKDAAPSVNKGRKFLEEQEAEKKSKQRKAAKRTKATGKRGPGRPPKATTATATKKKKSTRRY